MDKIDKLAKAITSSQATKNKTNPYDTTAVVKKIEGNTAWIHISDGVPETPAVMAINAKEGDKVRVNISGGSAYIIGNVDNPPTDDTYAKQAERQAIRATKAADAASEQATRAQTSADNAEKNSQRANKAADIAVEDASTARHAAEQAQSDADQANTLLGQMQDAAEDAGTTLTQIYADAEEARETIEEINTYAETTGKTVTQILNDGETAGQAAQEAKASAENASEYAARALGNLSTVQSVTETLNWITAHGTMSLTQDQQLNPTHVYFVVDAQGDYEVGGTYYSVVTEPDVADISTYYELSINESLNNYVGTHLAVTSEGLWLLPDAGGNKVLIATGQGSTYTTAGTYIIGKVNNVDTVFAKFLSNGATMMAENGTQIAHLGYGLGNAQSGTDTKPYYTFGYRASGTDIGNYSVLEGYETEASGFTSHAEGFYTRASGLYSHAEGSGSRATNDEAHAEGSATRATGESSHAEGGLSYASASMSHAQNEGTRASKNAQTSLGTYNIEDVATTTTHPSGYANYGEYAVIVGNGTANNARSNALTVAWTGDVVASGDITDGSGNVLSDKADTSIVPTMSAILDMFYPVGSYYETSDSTFDPNNAWGGTWYQEIEGQVHVSAGSNYTVSGADTTSTVGSETRVGTNRGGAESKTVPTTKLDDAHIAHGHGFTQPTIPNHSHSMSHNHPSPNDYFVTTNATSIGRRTIKNGTGTEYTNNVYAQNALVRSANTGAASASNTGTTPSATACSGGAVSNLSGASSTRTAHGHGSIDVRQPYINVYRWHRVA